MKDRKVVDFMSAKKDAKTEKIKINFLRFSLVMFFVSVLSVSYYYSDSEKVKPNISGVQKPIYEPLENDIHKVTINADETGHYTFVGYINGKEVKFFYDTGATNISIPVKVANYLGLSAGSPYTSDTANGTTTSFKTHLDSVKVGGIEIDNVQGGISQGLEGDEILLGMSFLKYLEINQHKNKLQLTYRENS